MINNKDNREKGHIEIIRDSPKNKSRVTIEYQFDVENDSLGTGGYGEVYKVKKKNGNMNQNEPEYALKIFHKENFMKDNDKGSRVLTEIKIQRSLNHEHVVKYEHSFEDKKNVYILMEYCGKGTLASLLKKRKYLEEYEIRYYMFQVLSALKYFRREKIVHRDLTLGNIFLKDIKTVKIGDFGFAYKESENEEKVGVVCGTPSYYTPESNNAKYSYKTDIYTFGLCIYYLFGGKPHYKQPIECAELFTTKDSFPFDKKNINFSDEALDLLKQLVTVESQRIDLDKIYNHPFFNCGKGLSKDKFPEYNENNKNQFFKELKELPFKEGLIYNHKRSDNKNNNSQNINLSPESQNINEAFNMLRNMSSSKMVQFNINDNINTPKINKFSNLKNPLKIRNERDTENSKNQNSDFFYETIKDKYNKSKGIEGTEGNGDNNNNLSLDFKAKIIKNDKDYDLDNSTMTFQEDNDIDKNKKLIYIDKINDSLADYCGIGYQLNNKNIGVYFNDHSQLLKIYNKNKYLLYFSQDLTSNNIYTREKIEIPLKNKYKEISKKIKFFIRIMESFDIKRNSENILNKDNINDDEENIIIEKYKYKYNKGLSFFLLSNKNIQVNFNDKTKIIFICGIKKKIIYIDNKNEISTFPVKNGNFNDFKCDDNEITKKIILAIEQINK